MLFPQLLVKSDTLVFVLRGQRTTANQITRAATLCISDDAFPEHVQHGRVAIVMMNAGAAELEDFRTNAFERRKIEELFAVVPEVSFGAVAGLHAIGTDKEA